MKQERITNYEEPTASRKGQRTTNNEVLPTLDASGRRYFEDWLAERFRLDYCLVALFGETFQGTPVASYGLMTNHSYIIHGLNTWFCWEPQRAPGRSR